MPQRLTMTTAEVERKFCLDVIDAPPPSRVEAVDGLCRRA
jgi:hypothetical protein